MSVYGCRLGIRVRVPGDLSLVAACTARLKWSLSETCECVGGMISFARAASSVRRGQRNFHILYDTGGVAFKILDESLVPVALEKLLLLSVHARSQQLVRLPGRLECSMGKPWLCLSDNPEGGASETEWVYLDAEGTVYGHLPIRPEGLQVCGALQHIESVGALIAQLAILSGRAPHSLGVLARALSDLPWERPTERGDYPQTHYIQPECRLDQGPSRQNFRETV